MTELELRFLGGVDVQRDGKSLALPPSKKTRALLAYLALNERTFSREHLCDLLWELPDDPRGSLRWSLSKLRRLVDSADSTRVVASRASVRMDTTGISIDVRRLLELVDSGLEAASAEALESAVETLHGNFLEGLELSNFHAFHAWAVSQRDAVNQAQSKLLQELVRRSADRPARALAHSRRLVAISPYDERARATLIRTLMDTGAAREAEQQYQLGLRMLREIGREGSDVLYRAWRGAPGGARAASQPRPPESEAVERCEGQEALVGRDHECALLKAFLSGVEDRSSAGVMLISGDAGMGKSRMLQMAREVAESGGARVLTATSFESEAIRPFAVWMDALRKLSPDAIDEVFESEGLDHRDRLLDQLSAFMGRVSGKSPLVLIFDDFHWCDESSAAALHFVLRMNQDRPLAVVLAARDDELRDNAPVQKAMRGLRHDGVLKEMRLPPLAGDAIRALIERRAPAADSAELCDKCAGNPLLAIELARAETSGVEASSLAGLIVERMARFDVNEGEIVHWAAISSPRIDAEFLAHVTGLESARVAAALDAGERCGMLVRGDRGHRFAHDLIAQCVYAEIPPPRRRIMHRHFAGWLEAHPELGLEKAADLSFHASQSGDPGLAARAMISAGRLCLRFFANDDALALAHKGLQWAQELAEADRVRATLDLHDIMLAAAPLGDREAAAEEYISLAERALDYGAFNHARLGYQMASHVRWMQGHWGDAREQALQGERVARSGSDREHVVAMAEAARCLAMIERDLSQADAMLMEARTLAQRERITHSSIPAAMGILRFHENALGEAEELFRETRTLCKSSGDRISEFQAIEYMVMIALERGDLGAARRHCKGLVELGANIREGSEGPFSRALDGLCEYAEDHASARLDVALDELRIADAKHRMAYVLNRAAMIDLDRGAPDRARERASEALDFAALLERNSEALLAHSVLASALGGSRHARERARHVAAAEKLMELPVAAWAKDRAASLLEKADV